MYEKLWHYQKPAADLALSQPATALFFDQGTGKTFVTCGVIDKLVASDLRNFKALLVVPGSTIKPKDGWQDLLGRLPIRTYTTWESFNIASCPKVLLLSYEGFCPKRTKKNPTKSTRFIKKLVEFKWSLVVFDESQKLKARGSRQSRAAGRIKYSKKRLILTGTPFDDLLNNPQEVWSQWRFLDPDCFGKKWIDFDERFLMRTGWKGYKREFKPGAKNKVLDMIAPYCVRVSRDVLGLKPLRYFRCPIKLKGEELRIYKEMEDDLVAQLRGRSIASAELTIVRNIRLHQVCGGFIKDDDEATVPVGTTKLRRLMRLLKKVPRPVVVFCRFLNEVDAIAEAVSSGNDRVAIITGKTRKTRTETINAFQRGKIDVLISQIRTGGVGINLYRSHTGIFFSTTYSSIDFDQAVSRLHRAGQKEEVKIYLLLAENSIDEDIFHAVLYKRSVSEIVLSRFTRQRRL